MHITGLHRIAVGDTVKRLGACNCRRLELGSSTVLLHLLPIFLVSCPDLVWFSEFESTIPFSISIHIQFLRFGANLSSLLAYVYVWLPRATAPGRCPAVGAMEKVDVLMKGL